MTTRPPRTEPVPRTENGRVSPGETSTPSERSAASTSPIGRVRMCGSPSKPTTPVESPAAGGTNRITVPASPQSTAASRSNGPGRDHPVVVRGVDRRAEGGERRGHQQGVARAQGAAYDAGAVGEGGEEQGPVGQRLAAGQGDDGVDRAVRPGCGPGLAAQRTGLT